ncbi:MAG: VWA domain-containing protein [Candidatus Kapabacteria bacterium]|nr:VWA domain-containing protein [Ignavibacteriota bacterium]MCW5883715.1 VWA domain-containing protein [Candidatus Kapabacteria bacterium]
MKFANPEYFYLFILVPLYLFWYIYKELRQNVAMKMSTLAGFNGTGKSIKIYLRHILILLRIFAISALILALARPQTSSKMESISSEGVDIVISLDVSTSMLAEDFKPNRIEAAKKQAIDFVDKRQNDRMGFVVFAAESFTQCPITVDHNVLKNLILDVKSGMVEDGTAIGMGIATAVSRLKESKAKSKVLILLTDGVNNTGIVAPLTAAEIAKTFDIRIYTIGVGTRGMAPYPVKTPFGTQYRNVEVEIDDDLLKKIAEMTGGKYFRATNNKGLSKIYEEIDSLEKTKIDVAVFSKKHEEYHSLVILALVLLLSEVFGRYMIFKTLP